MRLEIDIRGESATARLVEVSDFTSFSVVVTDDAPPLAERLAGVGIARLDEHAWVRIDTLRELAGGAATPAWEEAFAAMLEKVRPHGWVDDELGAVRGHVEREPRAASSDGV
jgi:hypothetical protein